jgi:hypothetical protein
MLAYGGNARTSATAGVGQLPLRLMLAPGLPQQTWDSRLTCGEHGAPHTSDTRAGTRGTLAGSPTAQPEQAGDPVVSDKRRPIAQFSLICDASCLFRSSEWNSSLST